MILLSMSLVEWALLLDLIVWSDFFMVTFLFLFFFLSPISHHKMAVSEYQKKSYLVGWIIFSRKQISSNFFSVLRFRSWCKIRVHTLGINKIHCIPMILCTDICQLTARKIFVLCFLLQSMVKKHYQSHPIVVPKIIPKKKKIYFFPMRNRTQNRALGRPRGRETFKSFK